MLTGQRLFTELKEIFKPVSKKLKNERLDKVFKQMVFENQDERISALESIKELKNLKNIVIKDKKIEKYANTDRYEKDFINNQKTYNNDILSSNNSASALQSNADKNGEVTFKSKMEAKFRAKYPKMIPYALILAGILGVIGILGIVLQAVLIGKDAYMSVAAGII